MGMFGKIPTNVEGDIGQLHTSFGSFGMPSSIFAFFSDCFLCADQTTVSAGAVSTRTFIEAFEIIAIIFSECTTFFTAGLRNNSERTARRLSIPLFWTALPSSTTSFINVSTREGMPSIASHTSIRSLVRVAKAPCVKLAWCKMETIKSSVAQNNSWWPTCRLVGAFVHYWGPFATIVAIQVLVRIWWLRRRRCRWFYSAGSATEWWLHV